MMRLAFTPEMAADLRVPFEPRLSPDGRSVAFRVEPAGHATKDRTSTIFVTARDGSTLPRPVTGGDSHNTSPVWSPDSQFIAFLSDRHERGTSQVFVVSAGGGEAVRLTDLKGGAGNISWADDGRSLLFAARRRSLLGEPDSDSEIKVASERWRPRAIARIPVTGGAPVLVGPDVGHVWDFALSPDGDHIAAMVSDTEDLAGLWDGLRLVVIPVDGGEARELLRLTGFPSRPVWSDDGASLAVVGSRVPDVDPTNVFIVSVESGDVSVLDDRGMTPTWAAFSGEQVLVHSVDTQVTRIDATDVFGSEWESLALGTEVDGGWIESAPNVDARDNVMVLSVARPRQPFDIYVSSGTDVTQLTDLNPQLERVELADMEPISWASADGLEVHGWLMLPPGSAATRPLPLVAAIHGGPTWQWGNWFHGTWHDWGQILATNGYAVLLPNPRGSTGRGGAFTGSNRFDFGGGDFDDIMTGIDSLIERGVADAERLGICGWSYGGFMTAWAVTQTDRFKAAVAGAAPTNWVSKIGTTDIRPFNEWTLGEVNNEPDRVWDRSPIRYARRVSTPTLFLHGEADPRVPVSQSAELHNALRAQGVDTDLVSYPRQGHAFHERAFQIDLLNRIVGWFDRYLGMDRGGASAGDDESPSGK